MTGRGIDQVLPHPGDPVLYEPFVKSAEDYVRLAEGRNGPIARPIDFADVWGDAPRVLRAFRPAASVINLETAVTTSRHPWPGKSVHYRMHPANAPCLTAARLDVCVLANNHVLDWGRAGLLETLRSLHDAGLRTAGAGRDLTEAAAPAIVGRPDGGRVLVVGLGTGSSGIPAEWAATSAAAGVYLTDLSNADARRIADRILSVRKPGDIVVVSIHWGGNWGHAVPAEQRRFAHALVDRAAADVVHGHSSHHPKPIEVHRGRLILYGCGDLLNDYEGISEHESYRPDLSLMYFPALAPSGELRQLEMTAMRTVGFRLREAGPDAARWLAETLSRYGEPFATSIRPQPSGVLRLRW
jgi:poly-gamma-glutamate synthesis protein (capsule biosynthesis protein)